MIVLSSGCQIEKGMGCNEYGTVRHWSSSRIRLESCTIFSAQIGATRTRFAFWVRIKWGILRGWLWNDTPRKRRSERLLQDHMNKGTTWHNSMLLTRMITTAPSIWRQYGQSVTTLDYYSGHWIVLLTLSLLYDYILQNWVLVIFNGRSISIEKCPPRLSNWSCHFSDQLCNCAWMGWHVKTSRLDVSIRFFALWCWNVLFLPERIYWW